MRKINYISIIVVLILIVGAYSAYALNLPKLFLFNRENALHEWQEKVFKNKVIYTVEPALENGYLSAKSKDACSGLLYRISFDAKKFPMMSWQWKILKFPDKAARPAAGGWIEKDDYAARVYVIFPSWIFTEIKSIEYVWDENIPEGTIMTSPYFGNIKLMVVESGGRNAGQWVIEKRNIYEDYKKSFGRYPSARVGAIAIMTDADNTLSTAEALYKDMKVGYKNED